MASESVTKLVSKLESVKLSSSPTLDGFVSCNWQHEMSVDSSIEQSVGCKPAATTAIEPVYKNLPEDSSTQHFVGSALQFLQTLLTVADYRLWDPIKDIKKRASLKLLDECRCLMWDQEEESKEL